MESIKTPINNCFAQDFIFQYLWVVVRRVPVLNNCVTGWFGLEFCTTVLTTNKASDLLEHVVEIGRAETGIWRVTCFGSLTSFSILGESERSNATWVCSSNYGGINDNHWLITVLAEATCSCPPYAVPDIWRWYLKEEPCFTIISSYLVHYGFTVLSHPKSPKNLCTPTLLPINNNNGIRSKSRRQDILGLWTQCCYCQKKFFASIGKFNDLEREMIIFFEIEIFIVQYFHIFERIVGLWANPPNGGPPLRLPNSASGRIKWRIIWSMSCNL